MTTADVSRKRVGGQNKQLSLFICCGVEIPTISAALITGTEPGTILQGYDLQIDTPAQSQHSNCLCPPSFHHSDLKSFTQLVEALEFPSRTRRQL